MVRVLLLSICTLVLAAAFVLCVIGAFKTFPDEGFNWMFVTTIIALLSAVVGFIPININLIRNDKLQGMPKISLIGFTIAIVLFVGMFVAQFINGEDKNIFPTLIMLILPIWILYRSYKRKK